MILGQIKDLEGEAIPALIMPDCRLSIIIKPADC